MTGAGEAAEAVGAIVANAEATTEAVVEAAAERVEQVERTAEQIAAAAMETEQGRRIVALETEASSWRDAERMYREQLTEMDRRLLAISTALETFRTEVTERLSTLVVVTAPDQSSSTLPASADLPVATPAPAAMVLPAAEAAVAVAPVEVATPKRRRWI